MYSFLVAISILAVFGVIFFMWEQLHDKLSEINLEHVSSIMPFDRILDDNQTILFKDGTIARILEIKPLDYSLYTIDRIKKAETSRQAWLDKMASKNARIRIFTVRDKKPCSLEGKFPNETLEQLHTAWMKNFTSVCNNRHFIMISIAPKRALKSRFKKIAPKKYKLDELVDTTIGFLPSYEPRVLEHEVADTKDEDKISPISPILTFLARIAVFENIPIGRSGDINQSITPSEVHFGNDGIIQTSNDFTVALNINGWGDRCSRAWINEALRVDSKITLVHDMQGHSPLKCLNPVKPGGLVHSAGQASQCIGGKKIEQEYLEVIEMIKNQEVTMYEYQMTIFVSNESKEKCLADAKKIQDMFANEACGTTLKQAKKTIKYLYLSQFPSTSEQMYPAKILSNALAHWISFAGEAKGLSKSDWGNQPLAVYRTVTGGVYKYSLHITEAEEELAHSLTIAPTGSGKTFIWEKMIVDAIRLGANCYAFDRNFGTYVFTNAINGIYLALSNMLNLLYCKDTPDNRSYVNQLLLKMSGCNDKLSKEQANKAVKNIFGLPMHVRTLTNILNTCVAKGDFKKGLELWTVGNVYGQWFNGVDKQGNAFDALDVSASHLVSFDMTKIQEIPLVAACVQDYIMHRIREELREAGKPHLIFIDEASPQLQHPDFVKEVKVLLQEHRKLRGSVNLCFQTPESVLKSGVSNEIAESCPTVNIFPNDQAKLEHYEWLNLTEYEKSYIKCELPFQLNKSIKRSMLVKKKDESIILNINADGMGDLLKFYRSGSKKAKLAKELKQQYGETQWREHYLAV